MKSATDLAGPRLNLPHTHTSAPWRPGSLSSEPGQAPETLRRPGSFGPPRRCPERPRGAASLRAATERTCLAHEVCTARSASVDTGVTQAPRCAPCPGNIDAERLSDCGHQARPPAHQGLPGRPAGRSTGQLGWSALSPRASQPVHQLAKEPSRHPLSQPARDSLPTSWQAAGRAKSLALAFERVA